MVRRAYSEHDGFTLLHLPRSDSSRVLKVLMSSGRLDELQSYVKSSPPAMPLTPLTRGGPKQWPEILKTQAMLVTTMGRWPWMF